MYDNQVDINELYDLWIEELKRIPIPEADKEEIYNYIEDVFYDKEVLSENNLPTPRVLSNLGRALAKRKIVSRIQSFKIESVKQWTDYDIEKAIFDIKEKLLFAENVLSLHDFYEEWFLKYLILEQERRNALPEPASRKQVSKNQFITKLTDLQRGKLFDLLVLHGFIPDNDKAGFIWVFGGKNDNYSSYSTDWGTPKNLGIYLVDCLCSGNYNFWSIGYRVFGIKGMAQSKNTYLSKNKNGKPKGYKIIDEIIAEVKK